jgi:hypothetical protein
MNVEEYVREALISIVRGVKAAQEDEEVGGMIGRVSRESGGAAISTDSSGNMVTMVNFDLATTVDEKTKLDAGVKADIKIFAAKAGGESEAKSSSVSRISFTVPVGIPEPGQQKLERVARRTSRVAVLRAGSGGFPGVTP